MARENDSSSSLNERAQHLLKVLIERYIREGEPVGSRALAREAGLDLSPATVRNVMADLEEIGLVTAPHTSAGRVPTVDGYRMFVDSLITIRPLGGQLVEEFRDSLGRVDDSRQVVETASQWLSGITQMAGVVMVPRRERTAFRQIEFLPLTEQRVLAILVTNDQEVQNRVIHCRREYSEEELRQAAYYLTEAFAGRNLGEVRQSLLGEMRQARDTLDRLMLAALDMGEKALGDAQSEGDFVLAGETNLMGFHELADMQRLRQLFDTFNEKHEILHLLDQCMGAEGANIFIGRESGHEVLDECSVVMAPYEVDDRVIGVLGVIGPTRMQYQKVIPIVDITAKLVGAALKSR